MENNDLRLSYEDYSPEDIREAGKNLLFSSNATEEEKSYSIKLISIACTKNDPEAAFILGKLFLDDVITVKKGTNQDAGLALIRAAANEGYPQARVYLNAFCEERYMKNVGQATNPYAKEGMLVDFDGDEIKINRKGLRTPIDAVLTNENGKNVLTLSANISFAGDEEFENSEEYRQAVINGILLWQGEYKVFGGQDVEVRINLTTETKILDSVFVVAINGEIREIWNTVFDLLKGTEHGRAVKQTLQTRRSYATLGFKWSATSGKIIVIQSDDDKFDDYEEIKHVAKHEFGHALGLGDLYYSPSDSLSGVEVGTYGELDSFAITDKLYNLVMCDHRGPVSNNDIEMVILAFWENKMQNFQPSKNSTKISEALGSGN